VDSEQYTDSIELDNPDIEKSMLTDELRTVNFFLNEDEEDEKEDHHSLNRPKNSIKNNSISYASNRKNTMNETSLNPGSVIVIRNKKEASLFSTQDSRKVAQNSAYKNHDGIYLKDLNETDLAGLSTVHEQGEYSTAMEHVDQNVGYGYDHSYNMFDFKGDTSFQKHPYENQSINFNQYLPNIDMSLIKGVGYPNMTQGHFSRYPIDQSSENKKQKKGKRNFWKVEDTSEFDIQVDKIFKENKTTLMVRNIPNKYTKELMLETIDAYFKDTYDFFYLPIDFKNNCNVGYAFINFKDLKHIEPFVKKFNQKKWAIFNSEKICSIKYARIQGKEECEKHFKDSSLMKQPVS
jgi:RNA recognition motif 2